MERRRADGDDVVLVEVFALVNPPEQTVQFWIPLEVDVQVAYGARVILRFLLRHSLSVMYIDLAGI